MFITKVVTSNYTAVSFCVVVYTVMAAESTKRKLKNAIRFHDQHVRGHKIGCQVPAGLTSCVMYCVLGKGEGVVCIPLDHSAHFSPPDDSRLQYNIYVGMPPGLAGGSASV
jgi:hypothetical protein